MAAAQEKQESRSPARFPTGDLSLISIPTGTSRHSSPTRQAAGEKSAQRIPGYRAISLALNRDAIVSRVMEGESAYRPAAAGWLPRHFENLKPDKFRTQQGKKLAGEADIRMVSASLFMRRTTATSTTSRSRRAVAQMLTQAGITTKVDAMPSSVYFTRATSSNSA